MGDPRSGDPAIRRSGDPAIRRSGDPAIRRSGDPAIRRSGDPAIRRSGDPAIRRSGDPAIRRSGDPAIRRSGDPAIRRSGDPAIRRSGLLYRERQTGLSSGFSRQPTQAPPRSSACFRSSPNHPLQKRTRQCRNAAAPELARYPSLALYQPRGRKGSHQVCLCPDPAPHGGRGRTPPGSARNCKRCASRYRQAAETRQPNRRRQPLPHRIRHRRACDPAPVAADPSRPRPAVPSPRRARPRPFRPA